MEKNIKEFKEQYLKKFGVLLSLEDASGKLNILINLIKAVSSVVRKETEKK
ncbi:MAG: hypothetical protein M1308_08015 [Actinobacteria bacterium]|nr:hypothetical protein [Actinomycetota bacterium]